MRRIANWRKAVCVGTAWLALAGAPLGHAGKEGRVGGRPAAADAASADSMASIGTIDGAPVPTGDLAAYLSYYRGGRSRAELVRVANEYFSRELVIRDVISRGLHREGPYRDGLRVLELSFLGREFGERGLRETVQVLPEEIQASLPERLVVGSFDLLLCGSEAEGREIAARARDEEGFRKAAAGMRDRLKSTGEILPRSGFFHKFDDMELFGMKAGAVAGYRETGIGGAVVLVKSVRTLKPEETSGRVDEIRRRIREQKVHGRIEELLGEHRYSLPEDRFLQLGRQERETGGIPRPEDVLFRLDDMEISYFAYKSALPDDYGFVRDPVSLGKGYFREAEILVRNLVLGLEAERVGYAVQDNVSRAKRGEWRRRFLASVGMQDLFQGRPVEVPEEEIREFYGSNVGGKFRIPPTAEIGQIFLSERKKADEVKKRLAGGESFEDLAKKVSEDKETAPKGGYVGKVRKDAGLLLPLEKAVFSDTHPDGYVSGVVNSGQGYHIVKIYRSSPGSTVPYEQAKRGIEAMLRSRKVDDARVRYLHELARKFEAKRDEDEIRRFAEEHEELHAPANGPAASSPHR